MPKKHQSSLSEFVKSSTLSAVEEIVLVDLISDQVGTHLSRTIILSALFHHFPQLPLTLPLVVLQLLADKQERNEQDSP